MLTRVFKLFSLVLSWLDVFFDTSQKLYPGRMAYKHGKYSFNPFQ
jgi:hypothetical protein